jgi:hypothetical protein
MKIFLLLAMIVFSSLTGTGFAQEASLPAERNPVREGFLAAPQQRSDVWLFPSMETALYSPTALSYGAGLTAAYGEKITIGFRAAFFFDAGNKLDALELNLLLRYYLLKGEVCDGPFLQITGGPAIFFDREEDAPGLAHWGRVSTGLTFGWRFPLGRLFFAEPYVRVGYPYIVGAGVSGGVRF